MHEAGKNLQAQKSEPEKEESENGKADVPEQEETAEINEEMVETEEVDTSEVEPLMPDFEVKTRSYSAKRRSRGIGLIERELSIFI